MIKVKTHLYDERGAQPENLTFEFGRVPSVGEHFAIRDDQRHYVVKQVVHIVSAGETEWAAEVWAHLLDEREVERLMASGVWKKGKPPMMSI